MDVRTQATGAQDPVAAELTMTGLLEHWGTATPEARYLLSEDGPVTWGAQLTSARRTAAALAAAGVGQGDRIAYLDLNEPSMLDVLYATAWLGAVMVPVNWRLSAPEMAAVVRDAGARVLVVGEQFAFHATVIAEGTVLDHTVISSDLARWVEAMAPGDDAPARHRPDPNDVVVQLYTSGTTGLPKGVMLTAANLAAMFSIAPDELALQADSVSLAAMPMFHVAGVVWVLASTARGGWCVLGREFDPANVLRAIERERVTETFLVPAMIMSLLACPRLETTDVSSLRNLYYGASPIADDVLIRAMAAFPETAFHQLYGLTETTGAVTKLPAEDHDPEGPKRHLLRSAGRAYPGVELRIVDPESGRNLPDGEVGELVLRSPLVMLGYWHKPEETAAVLDADGWFRTGDAGWMEDGYLFLYDRIKDLIISGGENVYPAEVENVLLSHPAVADVAVVGVPDDRWGETVKAIVVVAPGATGPGPELATDLIAFARDRLAHYKCPTSVDFANVLPRNPSGKLLKRELRAPYWQGVDRAIH